MISETVGYFRRLGREVIYDAEHFFDGYRLDADYALATLRAAAGAGAGCIVLCDTNGGELPEVLEQRVRDVRAQLGTPLGIHPHNDSGLAVANALAAVRAGCVHVQGTINGYGERCGNLDLIPLIATLQLKVGCPVLPPEQLRRLREVALFVAAVANLNPDAHAPYVGASAFAHKGGIHVAAVAKLPESYQHIDPALVGNETRVVVSELSGRQNIRLRADALGLASGDGAHDQELLQHIKQLEHAGLQFEAADGSFEMLVRRSSADYRPPFELLGFTVIVERQSGGDLKAQAMIQLRVGESVMHTAAEGAGPVNALDKAVRKALLPHYPELAGSGHRDGRHFRGGRHGNRRRVGHHLAKQRSVAVPRVENHASLRAAGLRAVLAQQVEHDLLVRRLERSHGHHIGVTAGRERLGIVEYVRRAVRHPRGEVATNGSEHNHDAGRHVFATVRAGTFDHRGRSE